MTLIEAQNKTGTRGRRYYKAFTASALDGDWQPLAARLDNPFASAANATIPDNWSDSIRRCRLPQCQPVRPSPRPQTPDRIAAPAIEICALGCGSAGRELSLSDGLTQALAIRRILPRPA